jgi:hypothetical protein
LKGLFSGLLGGLKLAELFFRLFDCSLKR